MKEKGKGLLRMAAVCLLALSICMLCRSMIHTVEARRANALACQLALPGEKQSAYRTQEHNETMKNGQSSTKKQAQWLPVCVEDAYTKELEGLDLAALGQINPQVAGWIMIPGTRINYPVVQGEDNRYYLNHSWEGEENRQGAIFLDVRCNADLTSFHSMLYGHNMWLGDMFAGLHQYSSEDFYRKHPHIYLVTEKGVLRYTIFSAWNAPAKGDAFQFSFRTEAEKEDFLREAQERSCFKTELRPKKTDRILTLCTCSDAGSQMRWLVQAYLTMELQTVS